MIPLVGYAGRLSARPGGGAVFSAGSITFCGSLLLNVVTRFLA